ncbi:MAG: 3-hydroxyacyl-CoA dehydrogenase, partial [Lentisphaeria bacterium]
HHLEHLGPEIENWWEDLGAPRLTPEVKAKLIAGMDAEIAGTTYEKLIAQRDSELLAVLDVLAAERADKT